MAMCMYVRHYAYLNIACACAAEWLLSVGLCSTVKLRHKKSSGVLRYPSAPQGESSSKQQNIFMVAACQKRLWDHPCLFAVSASVASNAWERRLRTVRRVILLCSDRLFWRCMHASFKVKKFTITREGTPPVLLWCFALGQAIWYSSLYASAIYRQSTF